MAMAHGGRIVSNKGRTVAYTINKVASTFDAPFTTDSVITRMKDMGYKRIQHANRTGMILSNEYTYVYLKDGRKLFHPKTDVLNTITDI